IARVSVLTARSGRSSHGPPPRARATRASVQNALMRSSGAQARAGGREDLAHDLLLVERKLRRAAHLIILVPLPREQNHVPGAVRDGDRAFDGGAAVFDRSEEHTSELQS